MVRPIASNVEAEFRGVTLGDKRLDRRLEKISKRVAAAPAAAFPKMVPTVGEREALYRFLENERVDWVAMLEPHRMASATRCRAAGLVRIAHDTSWFSFNGDRDGLGPVGVSKRRGFAGHFSLALTADEHRAPLGTVAVSTLVRPDKPIAWTAEEKRRNRKITRHKRREDKQSARWIEGVRLAEQRIGPDAACIHVMDQEADDFALLADLSQGKHRFVIRGSGDRWIDSRGDRNVQAALEEHRATVFRKVPLSRRQNLKSRHPWRAEREAALHIHATSVSLPRPNHAQHESRKVDLNVVRVFEPRPPKGEVPIEWILYTSETIDTQEALASVVDHYRSRWYAEEFFKALKTGCGFEKRQLESFDSLRRALALLVPAAWHLLAIRVVARWPTKRPASDIVDETQLAVLRVLAPDVPLTSRATARDVMLAVAAIGGHVKQNGDPGWLVLGRGYEDFQRAELVWRAAQRANDRK